MNENSENKLVAVAMQIILHAGNARTKVTEALEAAKKMDFEEADKKMLEAKNSITLAHKSQTSTIQSEASGDKYEPSLLFAHAQDTMMTIQSEVRMAAEMIDILRIIESIKEEN